MPQIDLRLGIPLALALVAIAAAVAIAIAFYRTTIPPISAGKRILLTVLRACALALIVLLLCEPLVHFLFTSTLPPVLTVLVDDSRSMSIVDRQGKRADIERNLLTSPTMASLRDRATVRLVPFGSVTRLNDDFPVDSLTFDQDGTDIAAAFSTVQHEDQRLHSNAILLLSDGIVTLGQNPLGVIASLPVPIVTVALGDSSEQRDVVLQRIASNAVVYSGTPTPVQAVVHASGYESARIEVSLMDGATPVGRTTLTLEPGSRDYVVPFMWTPTTDGAHTLTAIASPQPGELTAQNNRRSVSIRVRKSKLRLLIIAGGASHDVAFVRSTASEDPNIVVSTFVQSPRGSFYEGDLTQAILDTTDCIVLIGMPTAATSASTLDRIAAAINRRQIPILWIASRDVALQRNGPLAPLLPFSALQQSSAEQEISFDPTLAGQQAPQLAAGTDDDSSPWQQLPPVYSTRTQYIIGPGSMVLARAKIQSVTTPGPALIVRDRLHQRAVAILAYGIWRWRLLAQRSATAADFFPRFISNTIHWLTAPDETAPVIVKPVAPLYGQGEPISFQAQVYDVQQKPVDDAQVRVIVEQRNHAVEGVLTSVGNGRYEGTLPGIGEEGVFAYRASAGKKGVILGADSGSVRVGGTHVEFLTTETNTALLRAIAARTGGVYLNPGQFAVLSDELVRLGFFTPRTVTDTIEIQARSWPYLAGLIVLLLAIEWLIRKRSGML
jgi:hypothetical protein